MSRPIIWTQRLQQAVDAIAISTMSNDDVKSRAREMKLPPGQALQPYQVEFVSCLRQRLNWPVAIPSHQEFEAAWKEAYDAED